MAAKRVGFYSKVKAERLDEYRERHKHVWPEMIEALRGTGWRNYSIFLRNDGVLFGYVELDDLEAAVAAMSKLEVNALWQAEMAPFFEQLEGCRPDEGFIKLEEIFHTD